MNIYDISKESGVSIATVSRVINQSGYVSEKTRQKVQDAIDRFRYVPNGFARGMSRSSMSNIGILCLDSRDPYQSDVIYHLQQQLSESGYSAILCCAHPDLSGCTEQLQLLLSKNVDAIVCIGSTFAGADQPILEEIRQAAGKVPLFILNGRIEDENIISILCDEENGMKQLTESVLNAGSRHPMMLMSRKTPSNLSKLQGFKAAVEKKIPSSENRVVMTSRTPEAVEADLETLFQNSACDAILCADDFLALCALRFALKKGIRVPEELQITGFNGSLLSSMSWPEITTFDSQVEFLCRSCLNGLKAVLNQESFPQTTVYSGKLQFRDTSIPPEPLTEDSISARKKVRKNSAAGKSRIRQEESQP